MVNELVNKAAKSLISDLTTVLSDLSLDTQVKRFETCRWDVLKETTQNVVLQFPNGETISLSWTRKDSEAPKAVAEEDEFHA